MLVYVFVLYFLFQRRLSKVGENFLIGTQTTNITDANIAIHFLFPYFIYFFVASHPYVG